MVEIVRKPAGLAHGPAPSFRSRPDRPSSGARSSIPFDGRGLDAWWPFPLWSLLGYLLYAAVLSTIACSRRRSIRRWLIVCVVALLVYLLWVALVGSWGYGTLGDRLEAGQAVVVILLVLHGAAVAGLLCPGSLVLIPAFRRSVLGHPAVWLERRFDGSDEDVAAEDFGIW